MGPLACQVIGVDHVGVATPTADHPLLALLGLESVAGRRMPSGVEVGRFGPDRRLELVWPAAPGGPVSAYLDRRGPGLHHVALRVAEPLELARERLAAAGVSVIGAVEPNAEGRPSLFLHPRSCGGVLVELVEEAA